jgi:hypothetical protein
MIPIIEFLSARTGAGVLRADSGAALLGGLDRAAALQYTIVSACPVRLVAQDTRLSRGQQGFESPTGRQFKPSHCFYRSH